MDKTKQWLGAIALLSASCLSLHAEPPPSSYMPVVIKEDFQSIVKKMEADKADILKHHQDLLNQRYDLSNKPSTTVTMNGGKPVQEGVRIKLPTGVTWEDLAKMTPEEIKTKGVFPKGFLPLPHPHQAEGGMLFPKFEIDELKKTRAT